MALIICSSKFIGVWGRDLQVFGQDNYQMCVRIESNTIRKVGFDCGIDVTHNSSGTGASIGSVQVAVKNNNRRPFLSFYALPIICTSAVTGNSNRSLRNSL